MLLSIGLALIVLGCADGMVTFNHSAVIDESDFQSSSVSVVGLCSDLCHVYASIAPEHRSIADNLLIQTNKGFVSVSTVADSTVEGREDGKETASGN